MHGDEQWYYDEMERIEQEIEEQQHLYEEEQEKAWDDFIQRQDEYYDELNREDCYCSNRVPELIEEDWEKDAVWKSYKDCEEECYIPPVRNSSRGSSLYEKLFNPGVMEEETKNGMLISIVIALFTFLGLGAILIPVFLFVLAWILTLFMGFFY